MVFWDPKKKKVTNYYSYMIMHSARYSAIPLSTVPFLSALGLPSCNKMDSWALNFIGPLAKKKNNLTLLFSKKLCDWIIYSEWPGSCSHTVNQYIRKCMQHGVENMHSGVYRDKEGQGSGDTIQAPFAFQKPCWESAPGSINPTHDCVQLGLCVTSTILNLVYGCPT